MIRKTAFFLFFCWSTAIIAQDLGVSVTHASYRADAVTYTEFYFHVIGNSVRQDTIGDQSNSKVDVTYFVFRNDSMVQGNRLLMNSPSVLITGDSDAAPVDYAHMERLALKPGDYQIRFEFTDAHDTLNQMKVTYPLVVPQPLQDVELSDVRLLASYQKDQGVSSLHKNGLYLEPLPYNYYHGDLEVLSSYIEVYGMIPYVSGRAILKYSIQKYQSGQNEMVMVQYKKVDHQPTVPFLLNMPIKNLESGNYLFMVELLDEKKNVLAESLIPFSRSNPENDIAALQEGADLGYDYLDSLDSDRLDYYLKALVPVVANLDVASINYLLNSNEVEYKKTFIYNHFQSQYGEEASQAFVQYAQVSRAIDKMFHDGFGYGFESDRGRIYLKYGKPAERINVQDDEGAFPYEIWYYNKIPVTNQRDVRFLFYNPDYTGNRYILLTTTCRAERQNRQWELELYRNAPNDISDNRIDATRVRRDYRRRARDLYTE